MGVMGRPAVVRGGGAVMSGGLLEVLWWRNGESVRLGMWDDERNGEKWVYGAGRK
jgi:hypothetical protein